MNEDMRHEAIMEISIDLLASLLHLPEGAKVNATLLDCMNRTLSLRIEHPNLRAVPQNERLPQICPTYQQIDGQVQFVDWGENSAYDWAQLNDRIASLRTAHSNAIPPLTGAEQLVARILDERGNVLLADVLMDVKCGRRNGKLAWMATFDSADALDWLMDGRMLTVEATDGRKGQMFVSRWFQDRAECEGSGPFEHPQSEQHDATLRDEIVREMAMQTDSAITAGSCTCPTMTLMQSGCQCGAMKNGSSHE